MGECPNCKAPYSPEDRYCSQCGATLRKVEPPGGATRTQKSMDLLEVYYNLGLVYCKKGQYREALETWEKALARDPDNELLKQRIAEVQVRLGASS